MTPFLAQLKLPSRNDVLSIAERLTNLGMCIDDLGARLDELSRVVPTILQSYTTTLREAEQ